MTSFGLAREPVFLLSHFLFFLTHVLKQRPPTKKSVFFSPLLNYLCCVEAMKIKGKKKKMLAVKDAE